MANSIHDGHRKRMKERYVSEGIDSFDDHQVLELLLFYCIPYKDTNELAHKLMKHYGSLWAIFESDANELKKINGLGENSALLLNLIPNISRRYLNCKWGEKPLLNSTKKAGDYISTLFTGRIDEVFYVICLDSANKLNKACLLTMGTVNETAVYTRKVVENVLKYQAVSIILAHNHPGGSLTPSNADINVTKKIKIAIESISVKLLDHIIVAGDKYMSFTEKGYL